MRKYVYSAIGLVGAISVAGCATKIPEDEFIPLKPIALVDFGEHKGFNNSEQLTQVLEPAKPLSVVAYANDVDSYRDAYQRFQALTKAVDVNTKLYVLEPDQVHESSYFELYQVDDFNLVEATRYSVKHLEGEALDVSSYRTYFHEAFRRSLSVETDSLNVQLASVARFYGWGVDFLIPDETLQSLEAWSVRRLETVFSSETPTGYELSSMVREVLLSAGMDFDVSLDRRARKIEVRHL